MTWTLLECPVSCCEVDPGGCIPCPLVDSAVYQMCWQIKELRFVDGTGTYDDWVDVRCTDETAGANPPVGVLPWPLVPSNSGSCGGCVSYVGVAYNLTKGYAAFVAVEVCCNYETVSTGCYEYDAILGFNGGTVLINGMPDVAETVDCTNCAQGPSGPTSGANFMQLNINCLAIEACTSGLTPSCNVANDGTSGNYDVDTGLLEIPAVVYDPPYDPVCDCQAYIRIVGFWRLVGECPTQECVPINDL